MNKSRGCNLKELKYLYTVESHFNCEIIFKQNGLAWSSLEQVRSKLKDLEIYPNAHNSFCCQDPQGNIAEVYLFQINNELSARGEKYTGVMRDPRDVYKFLKRSRRVKEIVLVYK